MKLSKKPTLTLPILASLTSLTAAILFSACATNAAKTTTSPKAPMVSSTPLKAPSAQQPNASAIEAKLAANRVTNIARLRAYRDAGVFPINSTSPGMLNVFIDDNGHICAAANLMWQDGQQTLVQQTADTNNFLHLATVKSGPLMAWMLTSGFTQAEIARIQEPYMFLEEPSEPLQLGAEVKRLQDHFDVVLDELAANSTASIDAATVRLLQDPSRAALVASL